VNAFLISFFYILLCWIEKKEIIIKNELFLKENISFLIGHNNLHNFFEIGEEYKLCFQTSQPNFEKYKLLNFGP